MAEVVDKFLEEIYEECSVLLKTELFSVEEIRKFVKTRRAMLYKAERKEKRPMDYMALINFEMKFYALLGIRRKSKGFYFNKGIERRIIQRINRLYKVLCFRFQDQVPFWLGHISFCRLLGRYKSVDRELSRMLQMHGEKADLWTLAARWHFHERAKVRMAVRRKVLQARKRRKQPKTGKKQEEGEGEEKEEMEMEEDEEEEEEEEEVEAVEKEEEEEKSEREVRLGTVEDGIKTARETFHRGLKLNSGSARLHLDYFAFELDVADWARWRRSEGLQNRKLSVEAQDSMCQGELAGLVWDSIRTNFAANAAVIASCARLLEQVGWPRAEELPWAKEVFSLRQSLEEKAPPCSMQTVSTLLPLDRPPLSSPEDQVIAFEAALARDGPSGAMKVWTEVSGSGSASLQLLQSLIRLQRAIESQPFPVAELRKAFELMASSRVAKSKDFWLAYVAFEEENDPLRVPSVDWRARKVLPDKDLNAFSIGRLAPKLFAV